MRQLSQWIFLSVVSVLACPADCTLAQPRTVPRLREVGAQETMTMPNVVHVLGLENVRHNAKGKLTVETGAVRFEVGTARAEVPLASIEDVFTGDDSQRMIGGTLGTLSMFAPYGGGRFLSLFRKKVDVLTVEYRDSNGGLHGVIFMLPQGQAAAVKKQLIARGARASIPVEEESKQPTKKEKKS